MAPKDDVEMPVAPFQGIFEATPQSEGERKCDHCRWRFLNRYILAGSESHAEEKREEMRDDPDHNGMCGDCLGEYLMRNGFRVTKEEDIRPFAAGINIPAGGHDENGNLPPAGESYSHDEYGPRMERCPIDGCDGSLTRTKVVTDSGEGDNPVETLDTVEARCGICQRVLYKSEQVVYNKFDED